MYLLDTNIFLEILLKRGNYKAAKNVLIKNPPASLFISDFSRDSIGVFLFNRKKHDVYGRFVEDIILRTEIGVVGLEPEDFALITSASKRFSLDFDDAYQYAVIEKHELQLVSFDSHFDRTEKGRMIPNS